MWTVDLIRSDTTVVNWLYSTCRFQINDNFRPCVLVITVISVITHLIFITNLNAFWQVGNIGKKISKNLNFKNRVFRTRPPHFKIAQKNYHQILLYLTCLLSLIKIAPTIHELLRHKQSDRQIVCEIDELYNLSSFGQN